jgi:hypothetical protein
MNNLLILAFQRKPSYHLPFCLTFQIYLFINFNSNNENSELNTAGKLKALYSDLGHSEKVQHEWNVVYIFSEMSFWSGILCCQCSFIAYINLLWRHTQLLFLHFVHYNSYGIFHSVNTLWRSFKKNTHARHTYAHIHTKNILNNIFRCLCDFHFVTYWSFIWPIWFHFLYPSLTL